MAQHGMDRCFRILEFLEPEDEPGTIMTALASSSGPSIEFQVRLRVRAVRAANLPCCYCCRESIRACIFQLARDRCLASGFSHAMGFNSPAGLPALEPSGPLSDPRRGLCSPLVCSSPFLPSDALACSCRLRIIVRAHLRLIRRSRALGPSSL